MCDQSHTQKNIFIILLKYHYSCSCYINLLGFCDKIVCNIDGIITFIFTLKSYMGWRVREDFCCCCCWVLTLYTCMLLIECLQWRCYSYLTLITAIDQSNTFICVGFVFIFALSLVSTCVLLGSIGGWLYGSWWCFKHFLFSFSPNSTKFWTP